MAVVDSSLTFSTQDALAHTAEELV